MRSLTIYYKKIVLLFLVTVWPLLSWGQITISGKVTEEGGQALPGVTIIEKGSTSGTTTQTDGTYSLKATSAQSVLVFSFVGYTSEERAIGNRSTINVVLLPDTKQLGEVVVVGYGTQQKKDLTGSVASISAKELQRIPVSGLDQALQGQVPGLQISTTSGAPGGNTNILVRGIGSVSGGVEPLFVVDGFPINNSGVGNPLNTINPADIESIEILKDASATAIYGSRGSNGVIIVTTKRGKTGQAQITVDAYVGMQEPARLLKMMNTRQFAEFVIEGHNNGWLDNGGPNAKITDPNSVRSASYRIPEAWQDLNNLPKVDTDWQDVIFRNAPIQNYQVSATGGTEKLRYAISGGYFNQKGILISSGFERYSARLNLDGQLTKRLKVSMNLAPSYTSTDNVPSTGHYGDYNIVAEALSMPPMIPVYNPDGSYGNTFDLTNVGMGAIANPLKTANEYKSTNAQFRMLGNVFGEYELATGLKLKVSVGTDFNYYNTNTFKPSTLSGSASLSPATSNIVNTSDVNWLNENTINYRRSFGSHSFDALAGFTIQKSTTTATTTAATNFADDLLENINGGQITGGSYTVGQWALLSYLGRVNYAYNDRYLLTATIRTDGSSRFGSANRWGTFPSFSAGWRLSEEPFLKNLNLFDDFKIRAGYGFSGNNAIGNYRYLGLLSATNYVLGNTQVPGLAQGSFTNNQLGWETSKQIDIGLDLAFFNSRLQFTGDYYNRRNTDMLLNKAIPAVTGYTTAWVNIGELENKGVELALSGKPIATRDFQWTSSFNVTFNRNKVLRLGSEGEQLFSDGGRGDVSITQVGQPIGSFFGHVAEGVFLTQEQLSTHAKQNGAKLGDLMYKDVDGNGTITDADRTIIGNPQPRAFYGFNNTFSYKNWSLSVLMNGVQGRDVFWAGAVFVRGYHGVQNNLSEVIDNYWKSPTDPGDGKSPRIIRGALNNNLRYSSFFNFDGSYLRVRNVTLNYNLSQGLAKRLGMQTGRVYLTSNNLFTFTKYPGYDPEISNSGDNMLAAGIDYLGYPPARTFTLGLSLTF
ncbi:SusC/RagA family TonB-linked outer membrane protein [Larkinella humicola]|uniref:TonB-dependent receptor n=1 Tax=Larkinella humicola TaxID=2607654 RepID=A0A5N1JC20_9BACT|nr:TonB-dependent receptor [Larkinella humicola]KAA9349283.1 TonB-dependent receptor [Larkinella humicola]